ncbi:MAG: glucose-1-phosphate thymidylyltransferase [Chitinophagales bacterium]|nr:MAG: glucose-1-phosphate thymidylyltransferase [Chitinophagales bacterium]
MKVIIPVAGAGTKLRPLTYTQPKALIPVAGKRILDFIMDQLLDLNLNEFVFVIGYLGEKIKQHVENRYPHVKASYAVQSDRLGVGHAIWTAREFVKPDEEVLIVLGDTIVKTDLAEVLKSPRSTLGVKKVDDPRDFGVVEFDQNGKIVALIEKPRFPKSNMALVGVYKIKESRLLFECLDQLITQGIREGEEINLTDAIMMMLRKGVEFDSFRVDDWYDCGKADILLQTNTKLLKGTEFTPPEGMLQDSILMQPVHIASGTKLINSIIGPNVTIGENAQIRHSILSNSIIGDFANLNHVILTDSIIGSDTSITGFRQSLHIGDNTEIDFSGEKNHS